MDGNKVRKLRKEQGMNIDELSISSGFTSSYISQIERNLIEPSLSALRKICKVLNVSPCYFIEDEENNVTVIRNEDRQKLFIPEDNKELQFIIPINDEKMVKYKFGAYETAVNPGKWSSKNFIIIDSDKCVIIKRGTLLVNINDYNELLQEGDSIYIGSNIPHKMYNPAEEVCEFICITSPQLY